MEYAVNISGTPYYIRPGAAGGAGLTFYKGFFLPPGATITQLDARVWVNHNVNDAVNATLHKVSSADSQSDIAFVGTSGVATAQWVTVSDTGLSEIVADDGIYFLRVSMIAQVSATNARFNRAFITYRISDIATAI